LRSSRAAAPADCLALPRPREPPSLSQRELADARARTGGVPIAPRRTSRRLSTYEPCRQVVAAGLHADTIFVAGLVLETIGAHPVVVYLEPHDTRVTKNALILDDGFVSTTWLNLGRRSVARWGPNIWIASEKQLPDRLPSSPAGAEAGRDLPRLRLVLRETNPYTSILPD